MTQIAEVCCLAGRTQEGLNALVGGRGLSAAGRTAVASGRRHSQPALTPESCFQQALDLARAQQAKRLELLAAVSLARLWRSRNQRQDDHDLLASVYEWFLEGLNTMDLQAAAALLAW